MPKVVSSKGW